MTPEELKQRAIEGFERMFNQGDLDCVDSMHTADAIDHQAPAGTVFTDHLRHVISTLREAFPDLHFEIDQAICEGDTVACRSTMSGTHQGRLNIGPMSGLAPDGAAISVAHMHFMRFDGDRVSDLWHCWSPIDLARQLGAPAPDLSITTPAR